MKKLIIYLRQQFSSIGETDRHIDIIHYMNSYSTISDYKETYQLYIANFKWSTGDSYTKQYKTLQELKDVIKPEIKQYIESKQK